MFKNTMMSMQAAAAAVAALFDKGAISAMHAGDQRTPYFAIPRTHRHSGARKIQREATRRRNIAKRCPR